MTAGSLGVILRVSDRGTVNLIYRAWTPELQPWIALSTLRSEGIQVDDQTAMDLGEKVCMELQRGRDDGEIEQ
jgi:hypothetical protein